MKTIRQAIVQRVLGIGAMLRAVLAAVRLLIDPNRLDEVFALDRGLTRQSVLDAILDRVKRDPTGARALRERPRFRPGSLVVLRRMPEGTLGRAYAEFMIKNGLDPASIPTLPATDDASYLQAHMYETHDLWHVVLGFETTVAEELGVQAFMAAQMRGALPAVLISGALLQALVKEPGEWTARLEAVARGWTLGKAARPLFGVRWEPLLAMPLHDVRAMFHVEPTSPATITPRALPARPALALARA
jgi:ubiquinone biosynthesis protein COQ4